MERGRPVKEIQIRYEIKHDFKVFKLFQTLKTSQNKENLKNEQNYFFVGIINYLLGEIAF